MRYMRVTVVFSLQYLDGKNKLKDQDGILRGQIFQRPAKYAEN